MRAVHPLSHCHQATPPPANPATCNAAPSMFTHIQTSRHPAGLTFLNQRARGACGSCQLAPRPGPQLHIVHRHAHRDGRQRQRVAGANGCIGARVQQVAFLDVLGRQEIAVLVAQRRGGRTPLVPHQGDVGGAVGIVLQPLNYCRRRALWPRKVDGPIHSAVPAASVPRSNDAVGVAATGARHPFGQRLERATLPQALARGDDAATEACITLVVAVTVDPEAADERQRSGDQAIATCARAYRPACTGSDTNAGQAVLLPDVVGLYALSPAAFELVKRHSSCAHNTVLKPAVAAKAWR